MVLGQYRAGAGRGGWFNMISSKRKKEKKDYCPTTEK